MELVGFSSWRDVLDYASRGGDLYYKAPMDQRATRFSERDAGLAPYTYQVRARTIKMWPGGSTGRGRSRTTDPFTADSGHLDRFSRPAQGHAPDDWHGRPNEARETGARRRETSMSYGELPSFKDFERHIHTAPDPENDGQVYWPPGTLYPMELASSEEVELADSFGEFEEFRGQYGKRGFRGDERQIYDFLKFLMDQENAYDFEEGGPADLASSIMTTLGYEWI